MLGAATLEGMRDILPTLARWHGDGRRVAIATVVERRGSAPRDSGASLALNDLGEIAGSVTGGCVEPAVINEAQEVLDGGPARVREYGIADDDAVEVGLSCGGTVGILIAELDTTLVPSLEEAVRSDRPAAFALTASGESIGEQWLHDGSDGPVARCSRAVRARSPTSTAPRCSSTRSCRGRRCTSSARSTTPRRWRVSASCWGTASRSATRARGSSLPARFPEADELVVDWPDAFLRRAPVDSRTAICVLTHDEKFDVPAIVAALDTPAAYIGAMGSKVTTADREERLRAEGVGDAGDRAHPRADRDPIGARSPEEVAVAIAAEIVEATAAARRITTAESGVVSLLGS